MATMATVPMATAPPEQNSRKCLSCMPYKSAVLTIAGLSMLASVCDIVFGAVGARSGGCYSYSCYRYYVWYAWTSIGQGVVEFFMSILLLAGTLQKRHELLLTFMIVQIINGIGYFGNGAVMLTQYHWYGESVYYGVYAMLWGVLTLYFVTVVATYREWIIQQRTSSRSPAMPYYLRAGVPQGVIMQPVSVNNHPMVSTVSQQIGYPPNAQPGTFLPPGTYLPQGTYQPQVIYQPQGTYLPQGQSLPQETTMPAGVQTQPEVGISPETSSQHEAESILQQSNNSKPNM